MKTFFIACLLLMVSLSYAQPDDSGIEFITALSSEGKPCAGVKVAIYKDAIKTPFKTFTTDKKGKIPSFTFLPFNRQYKIIFSYRNCPDMFLIIDGNVPKAKETTLMKYEAVAELVDTLKNKSITVRKFNYPYTKAKYESKLGTIADDEKYRENFEKGVIAEMDRDMKIAEEKKAKEEAMKDAERAKKRKEAIEAAKNKIKFVGNLLFADKQRTKPLANKKVSLVNSKGDVLQSTTTNAFGNFVFTELPAEENFMVKVDETDPQLANTKIMVTNRNGKEIMSTTTDASGNTQFKFKAADKATIGLMALDENKNKADLKGKILKDDNTTPLTNSKIKVVNTKGETVATTTTDASGRFMFSALPADQNYAVSLDMTDTQLAVLTKVILTDDKGNVLMEILSDKTKGFSFQFLAADNSSLASMKIEDTELKIDFKGKLLNGTNSAPIPNIKINLLNEKNEVVMNIFTDANGNFAFEKINPDNYHLNVDAKNANLPANTKLVIADEKGKSVKETTAINGTFNFEFLPTEQVKMTQAVFDDPWLNLVLPKKGTEQNNKAASNIVIRENVYFKAAEFTLLPDAKRALDKIIDIMQNVPNISIELGAHTDSKGSDQYNMQLSEKRAKAAVDYIVANGIAASRITGKGYGETKLINNCGNNVDCPEEEHAKNRRIEFSVTVK